MKAQRLRIALLRGLARRCPQCGVGKLYGNTWYSLCEICPHCGCNFQKREGDLWWFFYGSTACITGFFIFLLVLTNTANQLGAQLTAGVLNTLTLIASLPHRKGMAIAVDWYFEQRSLSLGN